MRYLTGGSLAMIFFAALMTGCATRHAVVLVADPEGHIGQAEVITDCGTQRLEKAGNMTLLAGRSAPPSTVATADPEFIQSTFGAALGAEPLPLWKISRSILKPAARP